MSINNFQKVRKADGHKDVVLTCKQKSHQNKIRHKDWDQSFFPGRTEQPRFPVRNLVCLNKNDDTCNKHKTGLALSTIGESLKSYTCCKNKDWHKKVTIQDWFRLADRSSETKIFEKS